MSDIRTGFMKLLPGLLLVAVAASAVAQERDALEVRTVVQKEEVVVTEDGAEDRRLVPAETVVPGEQVFYTITFRNVGDEPAENVVITNPIASELSYVNGSAFGPGMDVLFSVDGGITFAPADELTITEDDQVRPAGPDDFTHIRWALKSELATGSQGTARFAAVLN